MYDAIHDALLASDVPLSSIHEEFAKRSFESRLKQLEGLERDAELEELKLYRLASGAVPWKKGEKGYLPSGEISFFEEAIVQGDTWATFMAFSKTWHEPYYENRRKRTQKYLPKTWEAGEDDLVPLAEEEIDDADQLADRVGNKLAALLAAARDEFGGEESKLAQAIDNLSGHATAAQEKTLEAVNTMKNEIVELRQAHNRQRFFMWVVIALLFTLLFMYW